MSENRNEIPKEVRAPVNPPSRKQALVLFTIAAVGLIVSSLIGYILPPMSEGAMALNLLFYLGFLGLPCYLALRRGPGDASTLRPNPISIFNAFSIVVLAVLAMFFVNDLLLLWSIPFQKLGFNINASGFATPSDTRAMMLCIIYAAVLPGIFEEILFRGMVMPAMEKTGTRRAIRLSALLFTLLHGSIIGAPGQFLLGMLIAELVICCDSIYAGLIFHTAYNASALILQYYQNLVLPETEPVSDYFAAVGGWGGVISLLVGVLFMGGMIRFSLRVFRLRAMVHGIRHVPDQPREPYSTGEKALLATGIALAIVLYAMDIFLMLNN